MIETDMNYCSQCPNHCPKTALKCGRGRSYFAQMLGQMPEENREHGQEEQNHNKWEEHGMHHGHGQEHGRGHGHGGVHGGVPFCDKDNLYSLMRACGHYLHHNSGRDMGQGRILAILAERKSMSQKELQEILQIQPGSVSEILSKLEEKGQILRKKDEEDKRRSVLELTDAGREAFCIQKQQGEGQQLFDALSESEKEELKKILGKLLESWK